MADDQLAELFASGTAPDRDAEFAERVDARIAGARRAARYRAHSIRALAMLALGAAAFVTLRLLEPALSWVAEISPEFMDVPAPLVLTVLAVGLSPRALRFLRVRLG